ncbi:MAG: hypothetical protein E3K37_15665 [Candidatus Kuenenia sp.]|nr:hypothetical protein [Candidatus Kuenenia hertensis]
MINHKQKERYKDVAIILGAIALVAGIIFIMAFVRRGLFLYDEIGSPLLADILTGVENKEEFVALLQSKISEEGYDIQLSIPEDESEDKECIKVEWKHMRRFAVSLIEQQEDMMSALKKLGIKKVILTNGEESWDVFP